MMFQDPTIPLGRFCTAVNRILKETEMWAWDENFNFDFICF